MASIHGRSPGSARLDDAFLRASRFVNEPEVEADYSRYLCILVTGFLEKAVEQVILDYVDAQGNQRLSSYVAETLGRGRSMRAETILKVVGDFDQQWKSLLALKLTLRHREAIGSVYASRNKIAHGEDVDLPYRQVSSDYALVREAVGFIEETIA